MIQKASTWHKENRSQAGYDPEAEHYTITGAVRKVFILGLISMGMFYVGFHFPIRPYMIGGGLIAFIIYMVTGFNPRIAPYSAPLYALVKGFFLGSVASYFASRFEGILVHAFSLTISAVLAMMFVYATGLIRVTRRFRAVVTTAVASIMLMYLINLIGRFLGYQIPFLHDSSLIGIALNLAIIVFACLNLLLNLDSFEQAERKRMPGFMEWYYSMAFLFTIIWLYIEFLRLLSKLRRIQF